MKIKTYNSAEFRRMYFDRDLAINALFEKSIEDFFCLRIEDLMTGVLKPIQPSREESHTLIYVTESAYTTKIGFKEYEVAAGDLLVIQAGAVFATERIVRDVKGFTCHFHPDILIGKFGNRALLAEFAFLEVGNHPIIPITGAAKVPVKRLFERLLLEFKSAGPPHSAIVHAYLYALLTELNLLFGKQRPAEQTAAFRITDRFRVLAHAKVKENLKVADFADLLQISPNHLNKSVKTVTGKSATEIISEIKLVEIKYLLFQSGMTISEIAFATGYQDPSYFTRFFKSREGVTPTEFRAMIEKS